MTKKPNQSGLPIQRVIDSYDVFQDAVLALNDALDELIKAGHLSDEERKALDDFRFVHSQGAEGRLQKKIDRLALEVILTSLEGFVDDQTEMGIYGIYDDETGHDLHEISFGPIQFGSDGGFIWREAEVLALLKDRDIFAKFIARFSCPEEWSDLPAATTMVRDAKTIDDDTARAGIREICECYENTWEPVGYDGDLETLFEITNRILRNCAPLPGEESSMSLWWIKGRCS
jgi:hypothetical protein